jgi:hypothetical protein
LRGIRAQSLDRRVSYLKHSCVANRDEPGS